MERARVPAEQAVRHLEYDLRRFPRGLGGAELLAQVREGGHPRLRPFALRDIAKEAEQGLGLMARFDERAGDFHVHLFGIP